MKFLCGNFNSKIIIWSREASKCFNSSIVVHYEVFRICPSTQGMIRLLNSTLRMPALHLYYSFCVWSHHGGRWSTPQHKCAMCQHKCCTSRFYFMCWSDLRQGKKNVYLSIFFTKQKLLLRISVIFLKLKKVPCWFR